MKRQKMCNHKWDTLIRTTERYIYAFKVCTKCGLDELEITPCKCL